MHAQNPNNMSHCSETNDELLEVAINEAWQVLVRATCERSKRDAYANMARLVSQRTDEQIEKMERERGLR